jgi:inosose dehydratase
MQQSRRSFITTAAGATAATLLSRSLKASTAPVKPLFSSNSYSWLTFYNRAGKEWMADAEACIAAYATTGLNCYEPGVTTVGEVQKLGPLLKKNQIELRSIYVGTTLHQADTGKESIDTALKIAKAARAFGTKIVVTNPSPIRWGNPEDKDDAALNIQAANLEKLGSLLKTEGMTLAYHNHDMELRQGAREFHHMLSATDPRYVSFCLDVHWIYRGCGNSQVALFDVARLYGNRIVELHIRQSNNHVWSEVFGPGDIDYPKLVSQLAQQKVRPHLVLEQCLEENSSNTTDAVTAHQQGLRYAEKVFQPLATE